MKAPGPAASLSAWLEWLPDLSSAEIELGLERVADVYARMATPRPERVLTVAGTNGKGSSVIMLEALLRTLGESVGAYTSPHILHYSERIRIDGRPAGDDRIVAGFERVEQARHGVPLTYFEFGTLAALAVFASHDVDTAVLEVGLGGRLDAVNVVDHDGCLVTNVSMDHSDWLGDDVEAIAGEKAGVMRSAIPAVFGSEEVPVAIVTEAERIAADLRIAGRDFGHDSTADGGWTWRGRVLDLGSLRAPALAGTHQMRNAAAVLALLEAIGLGELLSTATVNAAFARLDLRGRQQRVDAFGRRWLLDGAHNEAGAAALAAALPVAAAGHRIVLVLGMLKDKDVEAIVSTLAPLADRAFCVRAPSPRAVSAAALARVVTDTSDVPVTAAETPEAGFEAAVQESTGNDLIVVAGSFYTLESALRWLGDDADT